MSAEVTKKFSVEDIGKQYCKTDLPDFSSGDTVRVHMKITEGTKERIQIFEGIVIKRAKGDKPTASFTVRKISSGIGVERTFPLHSPRVAQIDVISKGKVRRARLFYLRPLRGKAARIKTEYSSELAQSNAEKSQSTKAQAEQ